MDLTQIIIVISVISITAIIVGCGVWLILILKELRNTLTKTNGILDDTKLITSSVAQPVSSISEFVVGFKNGMNFFNNLFNNKEKKAS